MWTRPEVSATRLRFSLYIPLWIIGPAEIGVKKWLCPALNLRLVRLKCLRSTFMAPPDVDIVSLFTAHLVPCTSRGGHHYTEIPNKVMAWKPNDSLLLLRYTLLGLTSLLNHTSSRGILPHEVVQLLTEHDKETELEGGGRRREKTSQHRITPPVFRTGFKGLLVSCRLGSLFPHLAYDVDASKFTSIITDPVSQAGANYQSVLPVGGDLLPPWSSTFGPPALLPLADEQSESPRPAMSLAHPLSSATNRSPRPYHLGTYSDTLILPVS